MDLPDCPPGESPYELESLMPPGDDGLEHHDNGGHAEVLPPAPPVPAEVPKLPGYLEVCILYNCNYVAAEL